ncbi:MAG: beta strand repeat-containing protein, partial [Bacteroidota bacterium]
MNLCPGGNITLNANTGLGLSYQWSLNGNTINGATNDNLIATSAGFYTVTVTNTNGCSSISSPLSVIAVSAPGTPSLSASSNSLCPGDSVNLSATPASSLLTYTWFKNGQPVSGNYGSGVVGIAGSSYRVGEAGTYTVQTRNNNGCLSTISNSISVNTLSNTAPIITAQPTNASVNIGDTARFTVVATNFDTITWQYQPSNSTVWINVTSGAGSPYLNINSSQLGVVARSPSLNGFNYRAVLSGVSRCVQDLTTASATLTVNQSIATNLSIGQINRCQTSTNDTLLVDVRADRFNQVALAQFAIQKPASFVYLGIADRHPQLFALNSQTQGNNLLISGFGSSAVNLPANSILFKLRMVVPSGSNGNESIAWLNNQTVISDALQGVWLTNLINGAVNTSAAPVSLTTATICQGQSFAFGSLNLNSAGTYSRTVTAANGCDSVINLTLNVLPNSTSNLSATICQGRSYSFGAQLLTAAGTYSRTLTAANGCDSLVTLSLSVRENATSTLNASICQGQTFAFGNLNIGASGTYSRTVTAANGCDSLITLHLIVNVGSSSTINASICQGQTYSFGTQNLTNSGTYQATLLGSNGCDSTVTLNLLVNGLPTRPTLSSSLTTACQGDSITLVAFPNSGFLKYRWFVNGNPVPGAAGLGIMGGTSGGSRLVVQVGGTYTVTVENSNGCISQSSLGRTLTFNALPTISQQPQSSTVSLGGTASFGVSTNGASIFAWEYRTNSNGAWVAISNSQGLFAGFTTSTLTFNALSSAFNGYQFRVKVKNGSCLSEVISDPATLTVLPGTPVNLTIGNGSTCSNQNALVHIPVTSGPLNNLALIDATLSLGNNLSFVGVDSVHPSITGLSVFQNGQIINLSWFGTQGVNISAGTRLFRLNIQATGSDSLRWVNAGFYDEYQGTYNTTAVNGSVTVNSGTAVTIQNTVTAVCQGSTNNIGLTATPTGGVFSGNGVSGTTFNPTGLAVGFYNITYTYTNPVTGCVSSANTSIEIAAPPTGTISANQTICQGQNVSLQATGGASYLWTNAQGTTLGTGAVLSVNPNATTNYFVRISNNSGCFVNLSTTVTVNQIAPVSIANGDTVRLCIGSSVTLQASGGYTSYQWFPVYAISNNAIANPVITPRRNETYTVFATNANGCVTSKQIVVVINPLPAVDAGNDAVYVGNPVNLQASGAGLNGSYLWSNGTNNAITSVSPTTSTTYYVTGTNSTGCSNTDSVKVFVPRVYAGNDRTVCAGESLNLLATMVDYPSSFPSLNYTWIQVTNGVSVSLGNTQSLSTTINSSSELVVAVEFNGGIFIYDTLMVTVASTPVVSISGNSSISTAPGSNVPLSATITGA